MSRPGPANYTANVNRAKTKKWVEAKSYSYDGDDWGDVDDYDEYGGYDEPEPEPAPAAKPTGLRQRGQSASQMPQEVYGDRQELFQSPVDGRQQYENLPGAPPQQQQHYGPRSFTNPQHQNHSAMMRSNSFDRDDERRAFSAGGPQRRDPTEQYTATPPQAQNTSTQDFQHMQQPQGHLDQMPPPATSPPLQVHGRPSTEDLARYGGQTRAPSGIHRVDPDTNHSRQANMGSRAPSMTSSTSAMDFHDRRDFSPSAMPPPLQTRGSPSPHSPDRNSSSRPPRKSSLGQSGGPAQSFPSNSSSMPISADQEDDPSHVRDRAGSGSGKPLPFVRPADIYRRMHEEKEKERRSQDSSRPSMDSITGVTNDRPSLGKRQESESSQRLKPMLDPVKERKSEYGMEGVNLLDEKTPSERRSTSSKTFEFPKRAPNSNPSAPKNALMPMLPDVSRVSGFGESFFGTTNRSSKGSQELTMGASESSPPEAAPQPTPSAPERNLQHQPSLGFTSAVHQAFDKAEDQVPPTPSSTQGSSVGRSTSAGTSTVSPIISRGPSTATENWNSRLPGIDSMATPMIPEGPEGGSPRPISSESLGTPTQLVRKPSPSANNPPPEVQELPPSFIPGYRRNSDTPSPDNSPRRTPALETNRQLRQPQEVEIAAATPTDTGFSTSSSSQGSEVSQESPGKDQPTSEAFSEDHNTATYMPNALGRLTGNNDTGISPISPSHERLRDRTDSSGSSRVRNLADKFESSSRPGSAHSSTPRASVLGITAQKKDDLVPTRPLADRMESFRPHLPGGWESSASIAPAARPSVTQRSEVQHQSDLSSERDPGTIDISKNAKNDETASALHQPPSAVTQVKDASEEAFAAVTAAGSALAGAFGAAVGMKHPDTSQESNARLSPDGTGQREKDRDLNPALRDQGALYPEASKPQMTGFGDEESSIGAPTPLPKDNTYGLAAQNNGPDYFQSTAAPRSIETGAKSTDGGRTMKPPPALPLLSTDSQPLQYESDRLRKEIVRELTPMSASEPTTAETDYSSYQHTPSTNASLTRPGHESGVLPREYESYWNDATSDDGMNDLDNSPSQVEDADSAEHQHGPGGIQPLQPGQEHEPTPSLTGPQEISRQRSPMLPHRFSWEQPLHHLPPEPEPLNEQPANPPSSFLKNAVYPEGHFQDEDELSKINRPPPLTTDLGPMAHTPNHVPEKDLPVRGSSELSGPGRGVIEQDKEVSGDSNGLELATSPTGLQSIESPFAEREVNKQDSGPHSFGNYSSEQLETASSRFEPPIQYSSGSPTQPLDLSLIPTPTTAPPKIPAFREILALKSPADRIRAYNESREQFANMNTGLAHWLAVTLNGLPEHADLLAHSGRGPLNLQGHKPSPSRSKLGGFLPSGGQAGHQPYFQQYLNASPQPATSDGNAPGGSVGGGSSPGFASSGRSGSKLSSQQVQAKGKDLLQSAGVFGGKANVAAKGLFSKGKSKLRAASGNEKAFHRQPSSAEPSFRGIQQPTSYAQALPPAKPSIDHSVGLQSIPKPDAPLEPLHSLQMTRSGSSRGTPSIVSVTQSQLGDDEFSEESEPTSQEHPPRASSLYSKQSLVNAKGSHTVQDMISGKDRLEGSSADSYVGSPKEIHTPRSVTSSNQTPTQATFPQGSLPKMSPDTPGPVRNGFIQREDSEEHEVSNSEPQHPGRLSSPQPRPTTQMPHSPSSQKSSGTDRNAPGMGLAKMESSRNSKSTIRNVNGKEATSESSAKSPNLRSTDLDRLSRAPERMHALAASEVSSSVADIPNRGTKRYSARPSSSTQSKLDVPRLSQDYSMRGPSIDGLPGHIDLDRPPSPVSLHQPNSWAGGDQRDRKGPVHYGLDHDFVPDSDRDRRNRSRSQSRARPLHRSSIDDDAHNDIRGGLPPSSYSGQISRDQSPMLRQRAPEYQIEGASPSLEWPSENKSRSRRGSRSSAFFKSLATGTSTKQEEPPLPLSPDHRRTSSPANSPTPAKRNSKRASIFRSLTGNSGSGSASGPSKEHINPNISSLDSRQHIQTVAVQPLPPAEDDEFPPRGNSQSAGNKLSKNLQRASTSSKMEQNGGKKKRFSGIGSLFGRGAPKRQSSSNKSLSGPQTQASSPRTSHHVSKPIDPPPTGRQDWYTPPKDNYTPPPPGGYYAPRPAQVEEAPLPSNPISHPYEQASPWPSNAPAYVQDASLRQQYEQQTASSVQRPVTVVPSSLSTFPQRSRQQSLTSVPRSSTAGSSTREAFPQRPSEESKVSGSAWTRFSQHGRSKSRQDHSRTPSHISQQASPQEAINYPSLPRANSHQKYQNPYHAPSRSDSPPPPPPPPKDDWNQPQARESATNNSRTQSSTLRQIPSQATTRPSSTQNRQSLPPLQTSMTGNRRSATGSGKTLTPEEKRKSRQQQIENSTLTPQSPVNLGTKATPRQMREVEDEPVIMSATSFPGQEWQPAYAHWEGD